MFYRTHCRALKAICQFDPQWGCLSSPHQLPSKYNSSIIYHIISSLCKLTLLLQIEHEKWADCWNYACLFLIHPSWFSWKHRKGHPAREMMAQQRFLLCVSQHWFCSEAPFWFISVISSALSICQMQDGWLHNKVTVNELSRRWTDGYGQKQR